MTSCNERSGTAQVKAGIHAMNWPAVLYWGEDVHMLLRMKSQPSQAGQLSSRDVTVGGSRAHSRFGFIGAGGHSWRAELREFTGRTTVYKEAAIYGDHNLELPALHSYESMVVVHTSFKSMSAHPTQAQVSLPLHARYPTLSLDGHVVVVINFPILLFHCSSEDGTASASLSNLVVAPRENVSWAMLTMKNGSLVTSTELKWLVPAGNPQHAGIVAAFTALFSIVGVVILWVVSMRSYKSHKVKVT
ncbi:hypothetical protein L7F22_025185 [Adiantum nelumboides]|nr:hypothetical protein [Adiantum nelumboides]